MDSMKKRFIFAITFFITISFFTLEASPTQKTPAGHVRIMLDEVMAIQTDPLMQDAGHLEKRRAAIKKVIAANIAFQAMSVYALGNQWAQLTPSERKEFSAIFKNLFIDSYARMVLNFIKQEKVLYGKEEKVKNHFLVQTEIIRTNDEITVDYTLAPYNTDWLISDIKVDGVSIAGNYRRAFARVIKKKSFQVLLDKMRLQQKAIRQLPAKP